MTSSDDRIKLGMTAKCSIVKKEASDVYAVPYDAVHKENGESYILVKDTEHLLFIISFSGYFSMNPQNI